MSTAKAKPAGRPAAFTDKATLSVTSLRVKNRLQANSERRAIINFIIDEGGTSTLEKLNAHFGFEMRASILSLINSGWIKVEEGK